MGRNKVAGRPTLQHVADRAGVSIATASRALTGRGQVAPHTLGLVTRAAVELGYAIDDARDRRRTQRLAVVVGGLATLLVDQIVEGIERVNGDHLPGCVVSTTGTEPARELLQLRLLLEDPTICAVIVAGGRWTDDSYCAELAAVVDAYDSAAKPLVFCGRPPLGGAPTLSVDYDNAGGAHAAVAHLLGQGHREILFVRGPEGFTTSDARAEGFRRAFAAFGVAFDPALVHVGDRDRRTGYEAVRSALATGRRFTAVFGECDLIAVGAMAALQEGGRRIPEECSVVGFDDILLAADLRVPLTTVHVPFQDIGYTAARMALRGKGGNDDPRMVAGTHLVVRASTGPLKAFAARLP